MSTTPHDNAPATRDPDSRRSFLGRSAGWLMGLGLVGGYGGFAAIAARFLFPRGGRDRTWVYVARVTDVAAGSSIDFRAPDGQRIAVARRAAGAGADAFVALSSTCPHLGCQVHWESKNARFFCPCHNGAFDGEGTATAGPPKEAGQSLPRFPLEVRAGLLFIEVPVPVRRS
ncbi:MAG: Rieske (2Fe-2S) protein [Planctomycetota bacterium]